MLEENFKCQALFCKTCKALELLRKLAWHALCFAKLYAKALRAKTLTRFIIYGIGTLFALSITP
jgi:hypothetical protein